MLYYFTYLKKNLEEAKINLYSDKNQISDWRQENKKEHKGTLRNDGKVVFDITS